MARLLDSAAACHPRATSYPESSIAGYPQGAALPPFLGRDQVVDRKESDLKWRGTREWGSYEANWRQNSLACVVDSSAGSRAHVFEDRIVATPVMQSRCRSWEGDAGRRVKTKEHVEPVASVLEALNCTSDVEAALGPWRGRLRRKEQSIILNSQRDWETALAVYSWIKSLEGYQPNVFFYNIMFKILGRAGVWDLVDRFWEEMVADEVAPTNITFSTLIDACGRAGRRQDALMWFQTMQERGLEPDQVTINTLINLHKRAGDLKAAELLFFNGAWRPGGTDVAASGPAQGKRNRDVVAYNTMIEKKLKLFSSGWKIRVPWQMRPLTTS